MKLKRTAIHIPPKRKLVENTTDNWNTNLMQIKTRVFHSNLIRCQL